MPIAIEILWNIIKKEFEDVKSLVNRRVQQDSLENLFGCITGYCGSNTNPTTSGFVGGMKTAVLSNMAHIASGNCEDDGNSAMMSNFKVLLTPATEDESCTSTLLRILESSVDINVISEDVDVESVELQACACVCGYLIKHHKNVLSNCTSFKSMYIAPEPNLFHNFMENKEYNKLKKLLNYATKDLIICVEKYAIAINALLTNKPHISKLKKYALNEISKEIFNFLKMCPRHFEENISYLKRGVFHNCVHRYCTLKNRSYAEESTREALQKKMNIYKSK